ncbi:hypothetical protein V6N13_096849 [Hibiscus sabdariffa]
MLMENMHRRVSTESKTATWKQKVEGLVTGSRYKILEENGSVMGDSNHTERVTESKLKPTRISPTMSVKHKNVVAPWEVPKNAAYLESNPPKKSSKKCVIANGL